VNTDIFTDRRAGQDRRQGSAPPPGGACRRQGSRSRRRGHGVDTEWWLRTDYVESEVLIQREDIDRPQGGA
jgi:hypothetical protein